MGFYVYYIIIICLAEFVNMQFSFYARTACGARAKQAGLLGACPLPQSFAVALAQRPATRQRRVGFSGRAKSPLLELSFAEFGFLGSFFAERQRMNTKQVASARSSAKPRWAVRA
jgi:hypothetical protein